MTQWDISAGSNHTLDQITGLPSTADNDNGAVRNGGTIGDASPRFTAKTMGDGDATLAGSTVVSGTRMVESHLGGANAEFASSYQVIRGVTSDLAGISNTELQTGASNSALRSQSIKARETINVVNTRTAIRDGKFNHATGEFDANYPEAGTSGTWDIGSGAAAADGDDHVANPSATTPGEIAYRDGSPAPVQDEYATRYTN